MVQNGKVKIYLADIRPLFDETMQKKALAQLDEVRRQKALSCRQTKQRAASLTAGLLAEEAKRRNGFDGCPVCYTKNGQPYLFIQDGRRAFLSLSHSGDYAVCAFSDCPVGVDLQQRTKIRRSVLQKFYLQEQLEAWKKQFDKKEEVFLSEAETERFLREWTVKESYVKLTGTGLLPAASASPIKIPYSAFLLSWSMSRKYTLPTGRSLFFSQIINCTTWPVSTWVCIQFSWLSFVKSF